METQPAATTLAKIGKPYRIHFRGDVVYCSQFVMEGLRMKNLVITFASGKYFPKRDCTALVLEHLRDMARRKPDHFTLAGLTYLGVKP